MNRRWAAPKLPRLSFNHLAVSGCTIAVPSDQLGWWRAGGQPRHTRRGLSMMVAIRQTPSAGRRFRVTRRPRVLGGSLLAERYHERALGIIVGARPSSTTGAGRRRGCERIARPSASRASTAALRPANRTSTDPGSTSPDAWMRRRTASGVSLTEAVSAADDRAGIGPLAETTLYAWMGDVRRFPNAKTLAAYAGLVPSVRQSGGVASYGEITKQGCGALRATLVHAAHGVLLYRCQTAEAAPLQAIGTRIRTSRGRRKIAVRGGDAPSAAARVPSPARRDDVRPPA